MQAAPRSEGRGGLSKQQQQPPACKGKGAARQLREDTDPAQSTAGHGVPWLSPLPGFAKGHSTQSLALRMNAEQQLWHRTEHRTGPRHILECSKRTGGTKTALSPPAQHWWAPGAGSSLITAGTPAPTGTTGRRCEDTHHKVQLSLSVLLLLPFFPKGR